MSDTLRLPPRGPCGGPALTQLRRLETRELGGDELARVRAHADACPDCQAVLREFQADRAALKLAVPFAAIEQRLDRGVRTRGLWRRLSLALAAPVAAAAAVLLLVPEPPAPGEGALADEQWDGVKGSAADLAFLVKVPAGAREGRDGEALRAGDAIRLRYRGTRPWVLVVGVDADGKVYPWVAAGDRSAPAPRGAVLSPDSIVLDEDPRPERIYALYTDAPLSVDEVRLAARDALQGGAGDIAGLRRLPIAGDQATVLLNKARPAGAPGQDPSGSSGAVPKDAPAAGDGEGAKR